MNIKAFLYSIRDETFEIKELQLRIEQLENSATGLRGISYDGLKVQTSPQDTMPDDVAEILKYKAKLSSKIASLNSRRQQAQDLIDRLTDSRERQVLDLYFLSEDRIGMNTVARLMHYSERETYLLYKLALSHLCSDLQ